MNSWRTANAKNESYRLARPTVLSDLLWPSLAVNLLFHNFSTTYLLYYKFSLSLSLPFARVQKLRLTYFDHLSLLQKTWSHCPLKLSSWRKLFFITRDHAWNYSLPSTTDPNTRALENAPTRTSDVLALVSEIDVVFPRESKSCFDDDDIFSIPDHFCVLPANALKFACKRRKTKREF